MSDNGSSASLLDFAESVAETMENQDADLVEEIALQHSQRGDLERAVELAETISDPYLRDQTVGYIAAVGADESPDYALDLLQTIEDPMMLEMAAERVATRFAYRGKIEPALEAASYLAVPDQTLSNVAIMASSQGFTEEAREVIASIESAAVRASTLGQLIFNSVSESPEADVDELISEMKSDLDEVDFEDEKLDATVSLATIYQAWGEIDLALNTFERAHEIAVHLENSEAENSDSSFVKDVALGQIAGGFARLKAFDKADQVLGEIDDPFQFATCSVVLALLYEREQHEAEINDLLAQARQIGNEQGNYGETSFRQRDALFVELARANASLENFDGAFEIASSIDSTDEQLRAITAIGEVAAASDDQPVYEKGASLLVSGSSRVSYWIALDDVFRRSENASKSIFAVEKAKKEARAIEDPFDRTSALGDIGAHLSQQSENQGADAILAESVSSVPSIESTFRKVKALLNLSRKFRIAKRELTNAESDTLRDMMTELE